MNNYENKLLQRLRYLDTHDDFPREFKLPPIEVPNEPDFNLLKNNMSRNIDNIDAIFTDFEIILDIIKNQKKRIINKKKAIIVDIDGTIAEKYEGRDYYEYDKVHLDKPIQNVIDIINTLAKFYTIIFLTGRRDDCREETIKWIENNTKVEFYDLIMRSEGDRRPDYEVKKGKYIKGIEPHYDIIGVFEDRKRNVEMFRELGLTVFQNVEGDY